MGKRGSADTPRRTGVVRAFVVTLAAIVLAIVLLLLGDGGPNRLRIVGRLGGVAAAVLVLLVLFALYAAAERRKGRTERDFEDAPWMRRRADADARRDAGSQKDAGSPAPGRAGRDVRADVERMLANADDALLALRDLAEHGGAEDYGALPALLGRTAVADWGGPRPVRANRLRRNGRWWLAARSGEPAGAAYDQLVAIEGTLNAWDELVARSWPDKMTDTWRLAQVFSEVCDLKPHDGPGRDFERALLDGVDAGSEWGCRVRLANDIEDLPAPFRVEATFGANLERGLVGVSAAVPRPECFTMFERDRRPAWARAYALRLALLLARRALASSSAVRRVAVSCHEHGSAATVLSLDLDKRGLERLMGAARRAELVERGLPEDPALRFSASPTGWLDPVEPLFDLGGEEMAPARRFRMVELDETPCDEALRRTCGASRVRDLGIMERAVRTGAWEEVSRELGTTTQEAVSRLVALREESSDATVAEACDRTCRALVDGTADVADARALAETFVNGHALAHVARRARGALSGEPTPEVLSQALDALEAVLSPLTESGAYLDGPGLVWRYFNSVPERVAYNLARRDGGREVRLVPDEYYAAHSHAARILGALGRHDEALAHAEELVRVAPVTPDALLCKARCLEDLSRIFEAADLLMDGIRISSTARDMAICFYRLAFMEWRLGRSDLSVACYQRAMGLHADVAEQAARELEDLLAGQPGLARLADDEVLPALEAGGIPVGAVDELRRQTRDAAAACTDAGLFALARPLTGALLELAKDDALVGVYRSLSRP